MLTCLYTAHELNFFVLKLSLSLSHTHKKKKKSHNMQVLVPTNNFIETHTHTPSFIDVICTQTSGNTAEHVNTAKNLM